MPGVGPKAMRTLCDVCEAGPARLFCAADEAALCKACDEKVHGCNKLASRHVRLELAEARTVPRCDICENAPAFFYCGIDGTSLCLQCDTDVHIGGKKAHERYLLLGQRVEVPGKQREEPVVAQVPKKEEANANNGQHHHHHHHHQNGLVEDSTPPVATTVDKPSRMIDLNSRPRYGNAMNSLKTGEGSEGEAGSDGDGSGVVLKLSEEKNMAVTAS